MFCQENGTENEHTQKAEQGKRIKLSKKNKIIIGAIVVAIIVVIVVHNIMKKNTSPEVIAQRYFEAVADANWDNVYEYYDFSESEFINKQMYKEAVKDKEKIEFINYQIKSNTS